MKTFNIAILLMSLFQVTPSFAQYSNPGYSDPSCGEAGAPPCYPRWQPTVNCGEDGTSCTPPLPACAPRAPFVQDPGCGEAGGPPCYDTRPVQQNCIPVQPAPNPIQY